MDRAVPETAGRERRPDTHHKPEKITVFATEGSRGGAPARAGQAECSRAEPECGVKALDFLYSVHHEISTGPGMARENERSGPPWTGLDGWYQRFRDVLILWVR